MNAFAQSVSNVFMGVKKAFRTFPASIGCALAFAVVTAIRIELDWPQQEPYNFLFNCLHWAFALGAVFSLAAVTAAQSRLNTARAFLTANLLGAAAAAATFFGLYRFGGTEQAGARYASVSALAATRVGAAILVCLIAFILIAGYPKDRSDFTSSFFMAHKAFFIALIYGLAILAGTTGVARAVQSLIYREMSEKVYMYIGTLVGFLTYTIFIGYFPDFRKGSNDERREAAQRQPRFIEVLFGYILIPIMLALTAVLLIWAGKTVLSGVQVPFVRLSAIAASYTVGGLWLHAMVAGHKSGIAGLYRRVYPAASIVILLFEAWAVINQLRNTGLKLTEYVFILIWVLAAAGSVSLLIRKTGAHGFIAVLACVLAVFSVLPAVGYQALPVKAQVGRLEALLAGEGMLDGNRLSPAVSEPGPDVRAAITDAVDYLADARDAKLPAWFDRDLREGDVFKTKLGFEKTWTETDGAEPVENRGTYLSLSPAAVDISGYTWAVNPQDGYGKGGDYADVAGSRGTYRIYWIVSDGGVPSLKILLNDRVILERDLNEYIDAVSEKYPPGHTGNAQAPLEDMSLRLETAEIRALLVFNDISISVDPQNDTINYWLGLKDLYLGENP